MQILDSISFRFSYHYRHEQVKVTLNHSGHLPLNNLLLQKRGVSKFIRVLFDKYSDTVGSLGQDKIIALSFPSVK